MIEIIPNWHPLFVHFTIALLSLSVLFFIIQKPVQGTELGDNFLVFARYALWLGVTLSVATVIAGWFAYNSVDHDNASHLAMTDHRNWAIGTFIVFLVAAVWLAASYQLREEGASILFVLFLLIGAGLLATTGFKGAELVYKYGLGVQSLPTPSKGGHDSSDGHAHDHAYGEDDAVAKPALPLDDDMTMDTMSLEPAEVEMPVEKDEEGITRQKLAP